MRQTIWTDAAVKRLAELVAADMNFAAIAKQMNDEGIDVTRNACLGKANRLGFKQPKQIKKEKTQKSRTRTSLRSVSGADQLPAMRADCESRPAPAGTMGCGNRRKSGQAGALAPVSTPRSCQWPHGDPGTPDFHFCGDRTEPGKPYCTKHCRKAYRRANWFDEYLMKGAERAA